MLYPDSCLFDIQTLIDASQPDSILMIGNSHVCDDYIQQRDFINKPCQLTRLELTDVRELQQLQQRFDLAVVMYTLEQLSKQQGQQLLAQLRDIYCEKFCVALPIANDSDSWQQTDLFAFAMSQVSDYKTEQTNSIIALYKYDIASYKKTPDWLNPKNWANPEMWNKFRW